ncbi:MAG: DUF6288 domain-containing protein [Planctomycetota bacterium]
MPASRPIARSVVLSIGLLSMPLAAQVHYHDDGRPWNNQARRGPDSDVPGWFYNLGITGLRVELMPDEPRHLLVRYVFEGSPAQGRIREGDVLIGVDGRPFQDEHQNGYGMDVFGARGPIGEFAVALEEAQTKDGKGRLEVSLRRGPEGTDRTDVTLPVGRLYGAFGAEFPAACEKSERIYRELCKWLVDQQGDDGSFGNPVHNTFAPLALLASGEKKYLRAVRKNVEFHARTTQDNDGSWLINWRYMAAGIVMSEYYLATREKWVLDELREVRDFIMSSQYTDPDQIAAKTKEDRPEDLPRTPERAIGGWGHNPGFEGYGPICMLTGEGALTLALMRRCGIDVDEERHQMAYDFLVRGTGDNGYVWYADEKASDENWADPGRTGAAGLANFLYPGQSNEHRENALRHARVMGEHPQSFPDTHGSPVLGMGWAAAATSFDPASFRKLMDANRWWFALAQCHDGTYYYQPNRDNAGYGDDSRMNASSVAAFLLSIHRQGLHITGKPFE